MKKEDKMTLYAALAVLGLSTFFSFMVFEKPDGSMHSGERKFPGRLYCG
ncbi:MAG: hypothetical protein NC307_11815 [Roseburia sp.]|nr:hypothetical protein [Roseburia sp.]